MLYFAYGSNLNHNQMQKIRCNGSKYLEKTYLKDYELSFCHPKKENVFGYANVYKKKGCKVPGAIWIINKKHEQAFDVYEEFPKAYKKGYFQLGGNKVMFYTMEICSFKKPSKRYVALIKEGYKNCDLDLSYLKKRLSHYNIKFDI